MTGTTRRTALRGGLDVDATAGGDVGQLSRAELGDHCRGVKSTAAAVRSRCVSWILLPDTDLTKPSTSSCPMGGAGGGVGLGGVGLGVVELADVLGFPVFSLLELPHAASDTAVAPVTARITS